MVTLNGLFSGLLVDRRRNLALLFNDRYGIERIYYHETPAALYFASEAKALLRVLPELRAFDEEASGHLMPDFGIVGGTTFATCLKTMLAHAPAAFLERHVPAILRGDELFVQFFSEPGAGSDLASLKTAARVEDGSFVLNGQKVWSSYAHIADFCILIAKSDPDAPRYEGYSYLIVDMHAPGVEVRPIRQLTGDAEFNEVFLTDVRLPDGYRLGPEGEGWRVAITTLMTERVSIGGAVAPRGGGPIGDAVKIWRQLPAEAQDPARRDRLMRLWVEAEATRLTNLRAQQRMHAGIPGPEGSIAKLHWSESNQRLGKLALEIYERVDDEVREAALKGG